MLSWQIALLLAFHTFIHIDQDGAHNSLCLFSFLTKHALYIDGYIPSVVYDTYYNTFVVKRHNTISFVKLLNALFD